MRIKTLSLVGFKSYESPTTLPLFHRDYTVIAGPNSSGKSNLLDAIIFALGSTDANPRQLVYNEGRTGITEASVSILFDNTEATWRPLGYEHLSEIAVTRQITLDGKDEYLINGDRVPPSLAHDLFRSVLLDVSRPHFLVRQGRVATVKNMKPREILSMLVEAADIPMDDIEAESKALEMKQIQIDEINELLHRHTSPALDKLWKERVQYTRWELGKAELERRERFCIAYEYVQAEGRRQKALDRVEHAEAKISELDENSVKMQVKLQELERKICDLTAQKDASKGRESELCNNVGDLDRKLTKEVAILGNTIDTLETEKREFDKIASRIKDLTHSLEESAPAVEGGEEGVASLRSRFEELSKKLGDEESDHGAILAGKRSIVEEKSLYDQLWEANMAVNKARGEILMLKSVTDHYEKLLKEKRNLRSSMHEGDAKTVLELINKETKDDPFCLGRSRPWVKAISKKTKEKVSRMEAQLAKEVVPFNFLTPMKIIRDVILGQWSPAPILVPEGAHAMDIGRAVLVQIEPRTRLDAGTWGTMGVGLLHCSSCGFP